MSPDAEKKLWRAGCLNWDGLSASNRVISDRKLTDLMGQLPVSVAALEGRVADYFLKRLPVGHRLRLLPDFATSIGFLDVETTGLGPRDKLTVVGLWRDGNLTQFVKGRNLADFMREWRRIEVLVTFNGRRFDWPVLAREFGLRCEPPHIDLMEEARAHGFIGGLKVIERYLGVTRDETEKGDGMEAVRLWNDYRAGGDIRCLDKLMRYNAKDVTSLVLLTVWLWRRSMEGYLAPIPSLPKVFCGISSRSLTTESLNIPPTG